YSGQTSGVQTLASIDLVAQPRVATGIHEFDRVLGGGLVPGSVCLIGGNPGAGKSTLLLQILGLLGERMECLYVTGEESLQQVGMRAARLKLPAGNLKLLAETDVAEITKVAGEHKPGLMVIDSIQV